MANISRLAVTPLSGVEQACIESGQCERHDRTLHPGLLPFVNKSAYEPIVGKLLAKDGH